MIYCLAWLWTVKALKIVSFYLYKCRVARPVIEIMLYAKKILKVPKRENFSISFFAQKEPIWICDVGTSKKTEFFSQLTPDFDGFWFFAAY